MLEENSETIIKEIEERYFSTLQCDEKCEISETESPLDARTVSVSLEEIFSGCGHSKVSQSDPLLPRIGALRVVLSIVLVSVCIVAPVGSDLFRLPAVYHLVLVMVSLKTSSSPYTSDGSR
ncbi:hypothetical protein J6590_011205 [Homalodisca vitripennis]|nr:hypothetical protein J6590_011205 [Homalodisca vitripennis]